MRAPVQITKPKVTTHELAQRYPRVITIDRSAFHLTLYVSRGLPLDKSAALRRALDRPTLRAALLRAARAVIGRPPALRSVVVMLSR